MVNTLVGLYVLIVFSSNNAPPILFQEFNNLSQCQYAVSLVYKNSSYVTSAVCIKK